MIPRTITAQPRDENTPPRTDPDIIPLPGANRRPEREHVGPPPADEIGPRDILNALRYHSVVFLTLGSLAALGLGALGWTLVPAKYTTYSMIHVSQADPSLIPSPSDGANRTEFATFIKTQAAKIKSTGTMLGALRDPKIAQLPMIRKEEAPDAFLEDKIITEFSDSSEMIKVMLSGDDPVQVTQIVNAVVNYYMKSEEAERQWKALHIDKLTKMRDDFQPPYDQKLKSFDQEFGAPVGAENVSTKQRVRQERYLALQKQKPELQVALSQGRSELEAAREQLKQFDATPPDLPDLSRQMEVDPNVFAAARTARTAQRAVEDEARGSNNPGGPRYRILVLQRDSANAELEKQRQEFRAVMEKNYRLAQRPPYIDRVKQAENRVRQLEELEQFIAKELDGLQDLEKDGAEKRMPERIKSQDRIQEERDFLDGINRRILKLKAELTAPERINVWQPAEVPSKSDMKKQIAVSGFGGILGLGLVGGCLSLYELRRKRVYGPKDPVFNRLPLLGCVPDYDLPTTSLAGTDGLDPAGRAYFEAVDKVKTMLCRQMQRRRMQALLVTSASPREGKSALAWHVAMSLARTDKRTLFIDGNLRNPGLHNHFDIASHPGLSELLRGEKPMAEVVQRTTLANLWCVAAGVCDEAARQALDKESLRRLLERARQEYDYVIIDTCSIREAVDPLYLAPQVDATVLSVRTFQSSTTDVERAGRRLSMLGTALLGVVLTDASGAGCEL